MSLTEALAVLDLAIAHRGTGCRCCDDRAVRDAVRTAKRLGY